MIPLSPTTDADELSAVFDDHTEAIYLGPWKELTLGNLRLVRRNDDSIVVEELHSGTLNGER